MRKLLKYLKDYRKESILAPLFKMLEASFELFVPLVMAQIIDVGIKNEDTGYILRMGGILVLLAVVGLTCSLTAQYFAARAAVGFSTSLRNDLFRHIQTLSYTEQDVVGTATLITRMTSDVNQVQSGLNLTLRLLLRSPFIVLGAMVMSFTVNAKAALTFLVTIPLLCLVVFGIMAISMPLYKKVQQQLDQVTRTTRENLTGVRVIRAFNRQEAETRRFQEENGLLVQSQVFVGKISALMNPITYVIINLSIVAIIWISGKQVNIGVLTQGETVALVNYMSQILVELIKMANLIVSMSKAFACANRISAVMDIETSIVGGTYDGRKDTVTVKPPETIVGASGESDPEKADNEKSRKSGQDAGKTKTACAAHCVSFKDVFFRYKNAKEDSLEEIGFDVQPGQTVGIIGGTGSGKTSVVNLIPRFYDVREGQVLVDGTDVREYTLDALRDKVGVVPQKSVLFKGTLRENMCWGKKDATDEEIYQALDTAQAREFVEQKGQGLSLEIEQNGKNLSGGQRQRLTIARALVKQPEILIMDDSASALDFATDAALRHAIKENTQNMTVFIVSQRVSTIRNADLILVMDDGKLAGLGTHSELLKCCEVYREICLSQLSREEVQ
ncbi:MAG: ABC transporter ATP-binding protein/permease [Lachnospiraceae bacterium]|nr:ABC transporter ATP-binding protein/permease [Lachnospiraceae bacterium]